MKLFRLPFVLLTLLLALALAFAACGGDDDDDDGGSASTATATSDAGDDDDDAEATPEDTEDAEATDDAGDDDDDVSSGDTCEFLTEDEASDALGGDVTNVTADASGCTWTAEGFSTLVVAVSDLGGSAEESFDGLRAAFEEEDVDGLGDEAFWIADIQQLEVRKGDRHILIGIFLTSQDPDDQKAAAEAVAEKVLDHIN